MKKYLLPVLLILIFGSLQAAAQYIPSGSGGGGGSGSNCVLNSSPSDILFNLGGTCAGNGNFTYDGTNTVVLSDGSSGKITGTGPADLRFSTADDPSPGQLQLFPGSQSTASGPGGTVHILGGTGAGAGQFGGNVQMDGGGGTGGAGNGVVQLSVTGGGVEIGNNPTGGDEGVGTVNSLNGYWSNGKFLANSSAVSTETLPAVQVYTNDTVTGTTAGKLVKLNSSGKVLTLTTADTTDAIGICVASLPNSTQCSNSGSASIAWAGFAQCFTDAGGSTAGDWVIVSTSVAGDCSDGGTGTPANVEVLGQFMTTNAGAGLYTISLNPVGIAAAASKKAGGGGAPTTCALTGNYACRNLAASWSAGQRSTPVQVSLSTSTFTPNMDSSDNFEFDLVHASCPCQIANPSNLTAGQTGVMFIVQSSTGGDTVTWGGNFVFPNGTPTLQTTASAKDYFSYYAESSSRIVIVPASGAYGAVQQVVNYNTASPPTFPSETGFAVNGANSTTVQNAASAFGAAAYHSALRADGTGASPSAVQSGHEIGGDAQYGFNGANYVGPAAAFHSYAAENFAVGHQGTKACIATTPAASTTLTDQLCIDSNGSITLGGQPLAAQSPQGRLTLITATPVMNSDQTAKSQIFYDCFRGKLVPYYDGTGNVFDSISSCEVSLTMQTSGTGVTNSGGVFDIWWVHSGANRICVATNGSGGGWASDTGGSNTARGTGYSQVHNTLGYWTNVNSITHCYNGTTDYGSVSTDQATYLGTITTTAAGQTGMLMHPGGISGGNNNTLGVWNAYNRVMVHAFNQDTEGTQTRTTNVWSAFGNNNNRINWVDGLGQSQVSGTFATLCFTVSTAACVIGLDLDSTSATPFNDASTQTNGTANTASEEVVVTPIGPQVGLHFLQPVASNSSNANTASMTTAPHEYNTLDIEM